MATIEKLAGKTGTTYRITVYSGFDTQGKRIRHRQTYKPEPGMTARQTEKAVQRAAADFERSIEQGYALDNRQTFAEYAEYVLEQKKRTGLRPKTEDRYRELLGRINPAIGHLKIADIRPQHLNSFYKNLGESGIRADEGTATAIIDLTEYLKAHKKTKTAVAAAAGISLTTMVAATKGKSVSADTADGIAKALGKKLEELFSVSFDSSPLSDKTILEHHRLISTILSQAEKEMLVPYNAAAKATPPRVEKKDPNYFQPEEVAAILEALGKEPLKWQLITQLMIVTGCRRGEIMGLRWEKVDFENNRIRVDRALLYTKSQGVYEGKTKTGDCRLLPLPAETMQLLRQHKREQLRLQLANGDRWIHTGYVFTQDTGGPMHPDSVTDWMNKFSKRHELPHINPHAFRHTMASMLYFNGVDSVSISKRLGHAQVSTTANIYAHVMEAADRKNADILADVFLKKA